MADEKKSHFILTRKVDEGFEIEGQDIKIILRRVQRNRAYFYICSPKSVRFKRVTDKKPQTIVGVLPVENLRNAADEDKTK